MRVKDSNKENRIFKASLNLIMKEGIAGLTMAKLAKKAGLATGTLYIYFQNKEVLIHKLYEKLKVDTVNRFMQGYEEGMDTRAALKKIFLNYLYHRIEHYDESVFMEQYYRSPYIAEDTRALAESMKTPVHRLIQKGKDEGIIRLDVDNEMLFLGMLGFLRELADEHIAGLYELNSDKINQAFELSWEMLRK
jgi:AcrR family transcriptional regulator